MTRTTIAAIAASLALAVSACGSSSSSDDSGTDAATAAPAAKVDPRDFSAKIDNPYYPLRPGMRLRYEGAEGSRAAIEVVTITHQVKRIVGVPCVVLRDRLIIGGHVVEDTRDWYTQHRDGSVWYFGEDTRALDGHGRVKSRGGSWQAGIDGARPGVFMPAHPRVGQAFQQEYYKGHAEDRFRITSVNASIRVPFGRFRGTAVRTEEYSRLEPGAVTAKYYARGIGKVEEADIEGEDHERLRLVSVERP
jgi:hypothetical protein